MNKHFGAKPTKIDLKKYQESKNWKTNKFENLEETSMSISLKKIPKILYKQFFEKKDRKPNKKLSTIPFDKSYFLATSNKAKFIWYGHSAILMRMNNKNILIDPMFGNNAAPISPYRFSYAFS
ncbi:MBL fold metallo-hydrolase [Flavobacterium jejuense]|uniref:MBL fold metallo-hydrolase n=1 Tax=Flavobacterium jejuense TaxID=1544455 RepID=UPI001FB78A91|nr:hypothetical protein [Flavobacterium jejuense]